jgi:hypothetical protein
VIEALELQIDELKKEEQDTRNQYTALKHSAGDRVAELEVQIRAYEIALHKIACAECSVHDESCEMGAGTAYCACDARKAGEQLHGYKCPHAVADKPKGAEGFCPLCYHTFSDEAHQRCVADKPLSDLGLDHQTYLAAKKEQAEGKRIPIEDAIKRMCAKCGQPVENTAHVYVCQGKPGSEPASPFRESDENVR